MIFQYWFSIVLKENYRNDLSYVDIIEIFILLVDSILILVLTLGIVFFSVNFEKDFTTF